MLTLTVVNPHEDQAGLNREFAITQEAFRRSGYIPHDMISSADSLIKKWGRQLFTCIHAEQVGTHHQGTLWLIGDGPNGLPGDEVFGQEINQLRQQGKKLVQFTGLGTDAEGGLGTGILQLLIAGVIRAKEAGYTCIVATVHPLHSGFYLDFGFSFLAGGEERPIPSVLDNPGVTAYHPSLAQLLSHPVIRRYTPKDFVH